MRIVGGKPEDLQRILGIAGASITPFKPRGNASSTLSESAVVYQLVAARATKSGVLHEFVQLGPVTDTITNSVDLLAYGSWAEKEGRLASQEESGALPTDPSPPAQAWTELQQTTFRTSDSQGNIFQNTVSVFRLNDISPNGDWYMVLTDPESQPNYQGCVAFGGGSCGWWTHQRVFIMSTTPAAILFDHGPINTITTSTAGFTISGILNATGPGVTATYTQSWPQPSVTTTDESNLSAGIGKWNKAFQDQGFFGQTPPETSIGVFLSHQGSIFQVPEGTSSFQFSLDEPVTSEFQPRFGNPYTVSQDYTLQINILPPVFAVSVSSLSIPPGGSETLEITALNPSTSDSSLGLAWSVTNLPEWLTVSQNSGSASTRLTLNVAPGTARGSVASININTNPPFAAPSVEANPLLVRVTVGQPNDTGILLAGGYNGQTKIQNIADLYSPQLGQFDFETTMENPRASHAATLLVSGQLLVTGGSIAENTATASAELFDPDTAKFTATAGMMTDSRALHTATLLGNGSVLLAGGIDNACSAGSGNTLASAELYDPATQTFKATGSMAVTRALHSSTLLLDSTVLMAGGQQNITLAGSTDTAEIYDPATGQFTMTAGKLISDLYLHTATLLKDGHVLIAGGFNDNGVSTAAELYNPATKTFSQVGNLNVARANHAATLLMDGQVLITGGQDSNANPLASAELYDPETQAFALLSGSSTCPGSTGCLIAARAGHTATRQLDGTVLVACGLNPVTQATLGSTEIYNPQTKTFSAGPSTTPKSDHTATLLQRPATTAMLASSLNPSAAGQKITLTATISTTDGVAAIGSVTFLDGTTVLTTVPLPPSQKGIATFSLSSLTVGSHSLTASYSGDIAHGKSTTPILVQNVKTQATTTALRSSPNPSKDGELVTFTATVTASPGTPTGSVIFRNNGTELQAVALTGNTAVFSTSSLGPGSNAMTATYSGDANFVSSGSLVLTQNVSKLPSTISLASNPNPAQYGQDVLFTATVTSSDGAPTGTVVFKDRNTVLQTVPVVSGVASLTVSNLRVGSHSITGTYSGDLIHAGVTSAPVSQQIDPALSTTTLTSSLNPSFYGQNVTFNATVGANAGTPTGTVTFSDNLTPLGTANLNAGVATFSTNALTGGTHQFRATYNGDGSHTKSVSSPLPQTVNKVATTTALSSSLNPSKVGQVVIFTATVSSSLGGSPAGIVTFFDGTNVLGTQSLSAGTTALTVSTLKAGAHNITANYGGSMNFTGSGSSVLVQNVQPVKATTTTSVTSSLNPSAPGQLVTFTATVTGTGGNPTGTVTFQDRANVLGTGVLSGGIANFGTSSLGVGTHSITAVYGGDVNFNSSRSPALTQTVNGLFPTSVSLTSGPNPSMIGQTVVFTATVRSQGGGTPTGTITLSEGSTIYGSSPLNNGVGMVSTSSLSAGMHVIAATYGGDVNHSGATSPTVQQQVNTP